MIAAALWMLVLSLCTLSPAATTANRSSGELKRGRNDVEFAHQGRTRTAVIIVPRKAAMPQQGWPLVMMLHGGGGSSKNVMESTGWAELGEKEGIVTVFPNGTPRDESKAESFSRNPQTWNSGAKESLSSGTSSAAAKNIDDVGFLTELIERVRRQLNIDPRRTYVAGHSNGAQMAYRFGSERSNLVAAVGVMAGHFYAEPRSLDSPVSLLQIVGDRDPFTPIAGGEVRILGRKATAPPALEGPRIWAKTLGLPDEPRVVQDDKKLKILRWGPAQNGAEVRSMIVKGHGHAYLSPQDKFHPRFLFGPTVSSINATETMWAFFKEHPKR
jgi:polyhydroxybutyrate depolymerase